MPSKKTTGKADIAIADSSATPVEYGFNLVRRADGTPFYEELTSTAIGAQQVDGAPEYADFRAEEELRLVGSDWRGGAGLEYTGYPDDEKRYHYTINCDARFKDELRLGPLATNIKIPPTPTAGISDASGTKTWSNPANSYDEDTVTYASAAMASATTSDYLELTLTAHNAANLYIWIDREDTDIDGISVEAYHTSTWNVIENDWTNINDGAWTTCAIGSTKSITGIRVNVVMSGGAGTKYIRVYEFTTDGAEKAIGAVQAYATFNSKYYVAAAKNLYVLDTTSYDRFHLVVTMAATITDLYPSNVAGTDYLFVMQGWGADYYYMVAAETFTVTNLTDAELKFMVEDAGTFYGSSANNVIRSTTTPLASGANNWATPKVIGDDAYDIVDIKVFGSDVYAKKSDCRIYFYDVSAGTVTALVSGQANISGTNTSRMYVHREAALVIPYGEQGLLHYDGTTITHIQPALYLKGAADFSGQVLAVTGDNTYLYVLLDDGTDVQLLATRQEYVDGATDWRWHPLGTLTITGCNAIDLASVSKKRIYIGSNTAAEQMNFYPVTTKYGDITNDANYTYLTDGYLITPYYHCNFRGDIKAWIKITLTQGHAYDADIYWEGWHQTLDGSWVDIGDFKGATGVATTTKFIPTTTTPQSTMMRFKFVGKTDDTAKTPTLLSFDIQAIWYPTQRKLIHCQIICEDDELTAQGTKDVTRAETKKALLDELYNPTTPWPRAFYKPNYESTVVYIKALPPKKCVIKKWEKGTSVTRISWIYDCWFIEVALS